jgi:hypothetical protein
MKVRITEKGVNDSNNNTIPVGTIIDVPGDTIPASLVNKCVVAEIITGQAGAGNPMTKAEQKALQKEIAARTDVATVLGVTVDPNWTLEQINAAITAAENPAQP